MIIIIMIINSYLSCGALLGIASSLASLTLHYPRRSL